MLELYKNIFKTISVNISYIEKFYSINSRIFAEYFRYTCLTTYFGLNNEKYINSLFVSSIADNCIMQ